MKAEDATRHMMGTSPFREEQEAWSIVLVNSSEVRDLDTGVDATEALRKAVNSLPTIWPPMDAVTPPPTPTDPRSARLANVWRSRKSPGTRKSRLPFGVDIIIAESCTVLVTLIAFLLHREREIEEGRWPPSPPIQQKKRSFHIE